MNTSKKTTDYKYIYIIFLSLLLPTLLLFIKSMILLDSDFGWHLKMGEEIVEAGVPKHDLFSYTMPSFPHVDHEWLSDVILYKLYSLWGMLPLAFLYSFLATLSIFIAVNRKYIKNNYLYIGIVLLGVSVISPYVGVRHQIISWFLLSILAKVLFSEKVWIKVKYIIPIFFLFWANLHGGFVVGLFLLWVIVVAKVFRGESYKSLTVPFFATLFTFINPYGLSLWREIFSSLTDARLRWAINEWMPSIWMADFSMLLFTAFSISIIFKNRKEFKVSEIIIFLVLFVQALLSRRNIPIWIVITLPLVSFSINILVKVIQRNRVSGQRYEVASKVFLVISFLIFSYQSFLFLRQAIDLREENYYPQKAILYLDEHFLEETVFSTYSWGGYIIWKTPRKVFIDGRMPSWKWNADKPNESNDAMGEYLEIMKGKKSYEEAFQKYQIEVVMLPVSKKETKLEQRLKRYFRVEDNFSLERSLLDDGWIEVYRDNIAVIYYR